MPEHWQPGRSKRFQRKEAEPGTISDQKYAWVTCLFGEYCILVGDQNSGPKSPGLDVVIYHPQGSKSWSIPLTKLTRSELDKVEELFKLAFRWAGETVDARDEVARAAFEAGDDSITRIYRSDPSLVVRKRPSEEHGEGVRQRSDGVSEGDGGDGSSTEQLRGPGDVLAGDDSGQGESQDDGPETDEP